MEEKTLKRKHGRENIEEKNNEEKNNEEKNNEEKNIEEKNNVKHPLHTRAYMV